MNILVIDTATEACSVALNYQDKVYSKFEICPQAHSKKLLPMVQSVLQEAGCNLANLSGLGVGVGPGSFTGVRIAMGMIQGLAYGSGLKVVGVSTLQAMAQATYAQTGHTSIVSAIDARMSEVYIGRYKVNEANIAVPELEEQVLPPATALEKFINGESNYGVAGTGWEAYSELSTCIQGEIVVRFPDAQHMLPLAISAFENGEAKEAAEIEPKYLRDKVTWKKLPGRE